MADSLLRLFVDNLTRLAAKQGVGVSAPKLSAATLNAVGRSTLGRYLAGEGNPTLDHIEALAKVAKVAPWELLRPEREAHAEPTLAQALDVVAAHLAALPIDQTKIVSEQLRDFGTAPDSQRVREALLLALDQEAARKALEKVKGTPVVPAPNSRVGGFIGPAPRSSPDGDLAEGKKIPRIKKTPHDGNGEEE